MELNEATRLEDIVREYPALKSQLSDINPRFKMLQTPLGKRMIKTVTIADMSQRSGMPVDELVRAIAEKTGLTAHTEPASPTVGSPEDGATSAPAESADAAPDPTEKPIWWDKTPGFKTMDVRGAKGNFFPGIKKLAEQTPAGAGIEIVQTFEPIPLYDVMSELGYERETVKESDTEYHVFFYRAQETEESGGIAFRPIALLNFPIIDEELGDVAVNFWNLTWNDEKRYLNQETRLLLSMANAMGAGRMRQATRELIKAYAHGIDSRAFDDVFELVAWNQGIGNFASEIGPSTLFRAYTFIKDQEKRGVDRAEIKEQLLERFGEKNPDVGVK